MCGMVPTIAKLDYKPVNNSNIHPFYGRNVCLIMMSYTNLPHVNQSMVYSLEDITHVGAISP